LDIRENTKRKSRERINKLRKKNERSPEGMSRKSLDYQIESVEISFIVHATEDMDRLLQMIKSIIPKQKIEDLDFCIDEMRGYYGNPISKVKTMIRNRSIASELALNIANQLGFDDKTILRSNIKQYVDESGKLYIRLDKQAMFKSNFKLVISDPIRVKVKLTNKIRGYSEALKLYCKFGFLGSD
jgi:RNA binding exosome subunit